VAIDGPINAKAASEILWHLYHRDVSVYRDGDDEWMVQFEARCRHLNTDNTCAIYEQRPHICRSYSEESCEVNSPDEGVTFYAPDAFLAYLAAKHKRIHKEVMAGYVPGPEHLGPDRRPRVVGPDFETRFRTLRAAGKKTV
jgi:Fe-S-cluster containining protein